uniref:Uncharacterized protein n=1 Tax=Cacopsylla melanoneura TaxID=428564 RepID=A0A8D8Y142_9HEMI
MHKMFTRTSKAQGKSGNLVSPLTFNKNHNPKNSISSTRTERKNTLSPTVPSLKKAQNDMSKVNKNPKSALKKSNENSIKSDKPRTSASLNSYDRSQYRTSVTISNTTNNLSQVDNNVKPNKNSQSEPNESNNEVILSLQKLNSDLLLIIKELRSELAETKKQTSSQTTKTTQADLSESSQPIHSLSNQTNHSISSQTKQPSSNQHNQINMIHLDESSLSEITHKELVRRPLPPSTPGDSSIITISEVDPEVNYLLSQPISPILTRPSDVNKSIFNASDILNNSMSTKPKLKVIGTSMTRHVAEHLTTLLPDFTVSGDTFPNAKMSVIFECLMSSSAAYGPNDYIFIAGGTNDIPHLYPEMIDKYLESAKHVFNQTNVVFCGIPYMYHRSNVNSNIFAINQYVQFKCSEFKIYFLDTNMFIPRSMFTKHGLHFNDKGKIHFSEIIEKLVVLLENSLVSFFPLKYSHPFFM